MTMNESVLNAVKLLDTLWKEVTVMVNEVESVLTQPRPGLPFRFSGDSESLDDDAYAMGDFYLWGGYRFTFPAKFTSRGRGRAGELCLMVDLGQEGRPGTSLGMPVVAWNPPGNGFGDELDAGFWPVGQDGYRIVANRLFRSPEPDPERFDPGRKVDDLRWFFVVPLLAISDRRSLARLVTEPALRLLEGQGPKAAFAGAEEVVPFTWADGKPVRVEGTAPGS